jgi:hypothetical protein
MADLANDFDRQRLMQLVDARCSGALDDAGSEELQAMLIASPSACAEYWAAIKIHAGLEWELTSTENWEVATRRLLGRVQTRDASVESSSTLASRSTRSRSVRVGLLLASAACLLIALFIGIQGFWRDVAAIVPNAPQPADAETAGLVLGRLTPLVPHSRWSFGRRTDHDSPDVRLGDTLSLEVGAVALRLQNDVVAQMKAPLVLHLISAEHVRLLHGRIQVDVPKGAEGFSVETATAEIVDFGTVFSVETVDGGTDLIVHQGEVDLKVTGASAEDHPPGAAAKRFHGGEAVRVDVDGTLSRIVNVQAADMVGANSVPSDKSLVASVRDNIVRDDMWKFYEIVPGGLAEEAKAFVDRPHEWNGATAEGLPNYLVGADYVKTFNDDKITPDLVIELELAGPAEVYIFLDKRLTPPPWLVDLFDETGDVIGIDESHDMQTEPTQVGPAVSIDQRLSVWRLVAEHGGVVRLGPNGVPAPHEASELLFVPSNMYGIAVVKLAEVEDRQ